MSESKHSMYNEVFVSYSRKNKDFAQKIVQAIHDAGREGVWIDWNDIEYAEDWWQKIQAGIDAADNFLFILTPDSILSQVCYDEVEYAVQSGKRIIPIVHIEIEDEEDFELIHKVISQHNWLPFKEDDNFEAGMKLLIQTIETDLDHVRFHTRLQTRARDWRQSRHDAAYLLSAGELSEAQEWFIRAGLTDKRPLITSLQTYYIRVSRAAESKRQSEIEQTVRRVQNLRRASIGLSIISIITIITTLVSIIAFVQATNRVSEAEAQIIQVETEVAERIEQADLEVAQAGLDVAQAQGQSAGPIAQAQAEVEHAQTQIAVQVAYSSTEIAQAAAQIETEIAQMSAWQTVIQEFNCEAGYCVDMVLVPPGCFKMGNDTGDHDENSVHSQCILQAFWMDRYEVSNEQFDRLEGQAQYEGYSDPLQPRSSINWFEALEFCILRAGTLPSEAQWEYAARGRNNLIYPWGNEFIGNHIAFSENTEGEPAIIGSYPEGASWVGAMDMLGNVGEWTSTIEDPVAFFYPYVNDDGRENLENDSASRVSRGGSFLDESDSLYSANRRESEPRIRHSDNGFRCVIPIKTP